MVSNASDESVRGVTRARPTRLDQVGGLALLIGAIAMLTALIPETREIGWILAIPAVILALSALGLGIARKRYAALGLLLGWFAFAYSFAMMLWG